VSADLLFGRGPRCWSRYGAAPAPRPDLSSESVLDRWLAAEEVKRPPTKSAQQLALERVREAAPETTRLYEKYQPTYRDHQVVLRIKTNLLGR